MKTPNETPDILITAAAVVMCIVCLVLIAAGLYLASTL